jgi:hypothetical protein
MGLELLFQNLTSQLDLPGLRLKKTYDSVRSREEVGLVETILQSTLSSNIQHRLEIRLGFIVLLFKSFAPCIKIASGGSDTYIICLQIRCCPGDSSEKKDLVEVNVR